MCQDFEILMKKQENDKRTELLENDAKFPSTESKCDSRQ